VALKFIRKTIKGKAHFDIYKVCPIDHVQNSFIPALFAAAKQDDFILPHHSKDLYDKYAGDKNIVTFDGDHNSHRPDFFFDSVSIFFYNTLQVEQLLIEGTKMQKKEEDHKRSAFEFDNEQEKTSFNFKPRPPTFHPS